MHNFPHFSLCFQSDLRLSKRSLPRQTEHFSLRGCGAVAVAADSFAHCADLAHIEFANLKGLELAPAFYSKLDMFLCWHNVLSKAKNVALRSLCDTPFKLQAVRMFARLRRKIFRQQRGVVRAPRALDITGIFLS